jgi:uncharacterized protein (TIGR02452 family)
LISILIKIEKPNILTFSLIKLWIKSNQIESFLKMFSFLTGKNGRNKSIANENRKIVIGKGTDRIPPAIDVIFDPAFVHDEVPITEKTKILFEKSTTDLCARKYNSDTDCKIAVMNFANRNHCGGGYRHGSNAQEEDLCRVMPELYASMDKTKFPKDETTVWISKSVEIMRDSSSDYEIIPEANRLSVAVVSAAAPNVSRGTHPEKFDEKRVRDTLVNLFISTKQNCPAINTLILGAWGCGSFGNNPTTIAGIMLDVCSKYGGLYDKIIFAIPASEKNSVNYDAFFEVFKDVLSI